MEGARQFSGFWLFLPVALALHLAVFALWPRALAGGANGAGEGGVDAVTLAAADGSIADLVAGWERPPEVAPEPAAPLAPEVAPAPDRLSSPLAAPVLALPASPPDMALPVPVPDAPPAPVAAPEAPPKPKAPPKATPPKPAKPAAKAPKPAGSQTGGGAAGSRAAGQGGGTAAGTNGSAQQGSLSPGQTRSLKAEWGGAIRARIERNRRQAAGGGTGRVVLELTVSRDGRLLSASVAQSSGLPALDSAALQAARSAGRFPPAPRALTEQSYVFNLPLRFKN